MTETHTSDVNWQLVAAGLACIAGLYPVAAFVPSVDPTAFVLTMVLMGLLMALGVTFLLLAALTAR